MAKFTVEILDVVDLTEIEGAWASADFKSLLEDMDVDDVEEVPADQLREMTLMFLQDRDADEAAALLLTRRLGDSLTKGQIANISHEMLEDKLWEQYSDMTLHERLFHVGSLLALAFERSVPAPDAIRVEFDVRAADGEAAKLLKAPLGEALVVRLLSAGMPSSAPLNRMFGDSIKGTKFPEAESIAWIVDSRQLEGDGLHLQVTGSGCWFDALRKSGAYEASAQADK